MNFKETDKVIFKYKRIQPVEKIAYCPACDVKLFSNGIGFGFGPHKRQAVHSCDKCKKEYLLDNFYPQIVYKDMGYIIEEYDND